MNRDYVEYWSSLNASHSIHPGNRFRYVLIGRELARAQLQPKRVVDCGCGDGSLLTMVTRKLIGVEVFAMDVAENVPVNRGKSTITFHLQDLGRPVPESLHGLFDLVLCSEVIEHIEDDAMVLQNLYRLASPGGTLVLTTQSGPIYKTEKFLGHLRHYDFVQLCHRVQAAGFRIRKGYRCGWPWLNLQKIVAQRFQDTVQKQVVQARELSPAMRLVFTGLSNLYNFSSRRHGPQIVILADKDRPFTDGTAC